jgi:hypothetical protein
MPITPAQARHIIKNWMPLRYHAEFKLPVGNLEKCVTPSVIQGAGLSHADLESEAGGMYVGIDDYAGSGQRVYTFDVAATKQRAEMSVAEFEKYKSSLQEGLERGG